MLKNRNPKQTLIIALLLTGNVIMFITWFNYLAFGEKDKLSKTLINTVQADVNPPPLIPHQSSALVVAAKPAPIRTELSFTGNHLQLQGETLIKLQTFLQNSHITNGYSARVLAGPVPLEQGIVSPQNAKMRAQNVARVVYPYTQTIIIEYEADMPLNTVAVELLRP